MIIPQGVPRYLTRWASRATLLTAAQDTLTHGLTRSFLLDALRQLQVEALKRQDQGRASDLAWVIGQLNQHDD